MQQHEESEMSIGTRIRNTREAKRISQNELAQLLGISPAAVCQWETKGTTPRAKTLKKVAEALGVSEGYLAIEGDVEPSSASVDSVALYIERTKAKIAEATGIDLSKITLKITIQP